MSQSSSKSAQFVPCEEGLPRGHVRGTLTCLHGHLVLLSGGMLTGYGSPEQSSEEGVWPSIQARKTMWGNRDRVVRKRYSHKKVKPDMNQVENLLFRVGNIWSWNNLFEEGCMIHYYWIVSKSNYHVTLNKKISKTFLKQ